MKQITVVSGKGGTGKTMLTSSFATLGEKFVLADCDVDAANLHLFLNPIIKEIHEFEAGEKAEIDKNKCIKCSKCINACSFNAISEDFVIDEMACEGCGLCFRICPADAIKMKKNKAGQWFISDTNYGKFVHAELGVAQDNSGKLVTMVRQKAREIAEKENADFVIIDGPPGTGCPLMGSITGVDFVVAVVEPTVSGEHDLKRVMEVVSHFKIRMGVVINKFNINLKKSDEIEKFIAESDSLLLGKIQFSEEINEAIAKGMPPTLYCSQKIKDEIKYIWEKVKANIKIQNEN